MGQGETRLEPPPPTVAWGQQHGQVPKIQGTGKARRFPREIPASPPKPGLPSSSWATGECEVAKIPGRILNKDLFCVKVGSPPPNLCRPPWHGVFYEKVVEK